MHKKAKLSDKIIVYHIIFTAFTFYFIELIIVLKTRCLRITEK